jgi:type II secretory pathway component HofQ
MEESMPKHPGAVSSGFVLAMALSVSTAAAQQPSPGILRDAGINRAQVTIHFQAATLAQVIQVVVGLSGRTIVAASEVANIQVTADITNLDWQRSLNQILSSHGLVARNDGSGTVRIEKGSAPVRLRYFNMNVF